MFMPMSSELLTEVKLSWPLEAWDMLYVFFHGSIECCLTLLLMKFMFFFWRTCV